MHRLVLAALGAAALGLSAIAPAQELPVRPGDYWDVTAVAIDDGHFGDYADYLAGEFRRQSEFAKSKGWLKSYHILSNNNPRDGEPDLYIVRIYDHVPTPAEDLQREKELNAAMSQSTRQAIAGSGQRATFRKLKGSMLLQELLFKR